MLIILDILVDNLQTVKEAQVPGARVKLVSATRKRKAYSCINVLLRASDVYICVHDIYGRGAVLQPSFLPSIFRDVQLLF